jgi:hypothetical protein
MVRRMVCFPAGEPAPGRWKPPDESLVPVIGLWVSISRTGPLPLVRVGPIDTGLFRSGAALGRGTPFVVTSGAKATADTGRWALLAVTFVLVTTPDTGLGLLVVLRLIGNGG